MTRYKIYFTKPVEGQEDELRHIITAIGGCNVESFGNDYVWVNDANQPTSVDELWSELDPFIYDIGLGVHLNSIKRIEQY